MSIDEQRDARQAEESRLAKARAAQFRRDVQDVFATVQGRRLLFAFLQAAGLDYSALRPDVQAMGHAIGWQDAARWWLDAMRTHCPEREANMRAEANKEAAQGASQDNDDE